MTDQSKTIDVEEGAYLLKRIRNGCREDGDCLVWKGHCGKGEMPVMSVKGVPRTVRRLTYQHAVGPVGAGMEVVSTCGTPRCVAPEHLKKISKTQRRRESAAKRSAGASVRLLSANRVRQGKLDMEKARAIRASEETGPVLAERYGVSTALISLVRRGQSWAEPSPWSGLGARA